jgi:hypothetical protein
LKSSAHITSLRSVTVTGFFIYKGVDMYFYYYFVVSVCRWDEEERGNLQMFYIHINSDIKILNIGSSSCLQNALYVLYVLKALLSPQVLLSCECGISKFCLCCFSHSPFDLFLIQFLVASYKIM